MKRAQTEDIQPSREFGVRNRRGGVDGDELDEIKEEHSDRQDKDEKVGELQSVSQIEDDSDLIYEKEMKLLLKDHKVITRFLMGFAIVVMIIQLGFAVWCLTTIYSPKDFKTEDGLLVIWYHILKILLNLYTIKDFISTMKAKQTSSPMIRLASYITLLMYYVFLFKYKDLLSDKLDI